MVKPEKIELTAQEAAQFWDDLRKEADTVHRSERVFRLGEMTLRIIFHEKRIEEYALGQLKTALLPQGSGAELTVHCLVSDALWRRCGQLPDEHRACLWCGERRMLFNLDWDPSSFYGSDGQEVWLGWRELGEDLPRRLGHFFFRHFARMLRERKTYMLHGGCVGTEGKGILLCGKGGSGKSTLSAACLLSGMDYVAEDYLLLKKTAAGYLAWPTYSTLNLTEEMLEKMPVFADHDTGYRGWNGKHFIDLSPWKEQFRYAFPLTGVLLPVITDRQEPCITPTEPAAPMAQLIWSTVRQTDSLFNSALIKEMSDLLRGLPTYKMELCPDVYKNAEALRRFIAQQPVIL